MRWSTTIEALPFVAVQAELASGELISIIPRPRSSLVTDSMAFCAANYHGAPDWSQLTAAEKLHLLYLKVRCGKRHKAAIFLIYRNQGYIFLLFPVSCAYIFRLALPEDRRAVLCPRHPPRESWLRLGAFAVLLLPPALSARGKGRWCHVYTFDATACDALLQGKDIPCHRLHVEASRPTDRQSPGGSGRSSTV
jgi:hypothetical protein